MAVSNPKNFDQGADGGLVFDLTEVLDVMCLMGWIHQVLTMGLEPEDQDEHFIDAFPAGRLSTEVYPEVRKLLGGDAREVSAGSVSLVEFVRDVEKLFEQLRLA